jgi:HEAT repeat protein
MRPPSSQPWTARWIVLLLALSLGHPVPLSSARAETPDDRDDEQTLHDAGLSTDGPTLLAFFQARTRTGIDGERVRHLLRRFASASQPERSAATAELLGLGPLALPVLRQIANDLDHPEIADRASRCLKWLEGMGGSALPITAARVLAKRKPDGTAAALLAYLPFADNAEVGRAVTDALAVVAAPDGNPDPIVVRALGDPSAARRIAAAVALCRAIPPDRVRAVRQLLHDPVPGVRLRAALALAEARDAEAVPVLIELLTDLPAEQRGTAEELLRELAAEWAPIVNYPSEDEIGRRIRHDAWADWWRNTDSAALLAAVRTRTRTAEDCAKIQELVGQLGAADFALRETASGELFALGRRSLPQLREAIRDKDLEVARRARLLIGQIEREPAYHLPVAAVRLLGVRKPAGSVEALLEYLPYAEDETRSGEVHQALLALARSEGRPHPALLHALADPRPAVRSAAAEALVHGAGSAGRSAVRRLLHNDAPAVRLRVALALAKALERDSVPVLIDLLTELPPGQVGEVEAALYQLAGDAAPAASAGEKPAERQKCRAAWAAWWKANAGRVDLARLTKRPWFGYTLVCDPGGGRVYEIDRHGNERWTIKVAAAVDAWVVGGNRVLIAEGGTNRITERDFQGRILWEKPCTAPMSVQPLPNGNILIANAARVAEVDHAGKELYAVEPRKGGAIWDAYRLRGGAIVCMMRENQCLVLDTTGRQLKSFATNHGGMGSLDLLANGRILIAQPNRNKVVEFDSDGKTLWEADAPGVTAATGLPNGHVLVTSQARHLVFELDRAGKVVWEHKTTQGVFRARRR